MNATSRNESIASDYSENPDPRRRKPVGTLAAIHHDLPQLQCEYRTDDAEPVGASRTFETAQIGWVVQESGHHKGDSYSDRHVDVEVLAPVPVRSDVTTDGRAEQRSNRHANAQRAIASV